MHSLRRARVIFAALALGTILVGLAVHFHGTFLPGAIRDALGDALWAMMITWLIGALVPDKSIVARAGVALVICFLVEASQMYHSQFLDSLRHSRFGHLFLGSDFDFRDLGSYALGVAMAFGLEATFRFRRRPPESTVV